MTSQTFFKGLAMTLIAVLVSYFSITPIDFLMMAVAAASAILVYVGKNLVAVLHSDSLVGELSWINAISGVLIAIGTAVVNGVATYLINGVIEWPVLIKLVIAVTLTYLGGTFLSPTHNASKKLI